MIYINETPVNIVKFNGGEIQVNINNIQLNEIIEKEICIKAIIKNSDDVMALIQTKIIIDKYNPKEVILYLPRIPYAQSDRAMTQHECSGLKIFANLINNLNFKKVCVEDPHSDVSEALINNILIKEQYQCLNKFKNEIKEVGYSFLISPDGGALKKIYKSSKLLQLPVIEASKQRDVITGQITKTTVNANGNDLEGSSVLIIDDIAEYSTTTRELAKILKEEYGVKQVDSYVTHGLYPLNKRVTPHSRFSYPLDYIDKLYVYNLWQGNEPIPSNVIYRSIF